MWPRPRHEFAAFKSLQDVKFKEHLSAAIRRHSIYAHFIPTSKLLFQRSVYSHLIHKGSRDIIPISDKTFPDKMPASDGLELLVTQDPRIDQALCVTELVHSAIFRAYVRHRSQCVRNCWTSVSAQACMQRSVNYLNRWGLAGRGPREGCMGSDPAGIRIYMQHMHVMYIF